MQVVTINCEFSLPCLKPIYSGHDIMKLHEAHLLSLKCTGTLQVGVAKFQCRDIARILYCKEICVARWIHGL